MTAGSRVICLVICISLAAAFMPAAVSAQEGVTRSLKGEALTYIPDEDEKKVPGMRLEMEKPSYRVGDVMVIKMEFINMTPDPGGLWMLVVLPQVTHDDGEAVEKFPLAKFRSKLDSTDLEKIKDFRGANEGRIRYVFWKIEDKQWQNERTGEVVYDGVGFEGGVTPLGTFVYCLNKVPGKYKILLTRMLQRRWDPSKYDPGVEPSNFMKSNIVEVEILPAEERQQEEGAADEL